jgi:hypothetical protein
MLKMRIFLLVVVVVPVWRSSIRVGGRRRSNHSGAARGGTAELQSGVVAGSSQGRGKNGLFAGAT